MAIDIGTNQNKLHSIKLLAAQRQLYTEAKFIRNLRLVGSILLAVFAPFIIFFRPDWDLILGAVGGLWLLLDNAWLRHVEDSKVKQAATIQEEFDTNLFQLPWNRMLVGDRIAPELISAAEQRDKGGRAELRDWYPDVDGVSYPLDVLICQRLNLVWDWQLRRQYAQGILVLVITYISLLIIFAISQGLLLLDFALGLLLPGSAAIAEGLSLVIEHLRLAKDKEETAQKVLALWEDGLRDPQSVTSEHSRDIQNCIYIYRSTGPLVPDWWYNRLRDNFEIDMRGTADQLKDQAKKALSP